MLRPYWVPLIAALSGCAIVPTPVDDAAMMGLTLTNVDALTRSNEPVVGAISVYEALARALKYNLDAQVELYQAALRGDEARLATTQLLPSLTAQAGFTARNNDLETAKFDIPTGIEAQASSVSNDRQYDSADATASWNVLDMALSYVRARQATDQQLIALEGRRKAVQRIIEDTRTAYWRAVSCDRLLQRFARMEERAKRAIRNTKAARQSGAETPMTALSYERELVQILQTAERLKHELVLAKSQLAALINVPPGVAFKLGDSLEQPDPVVAHLTLADLFAEAVFNRPEIRDVAYRQRINEQEATAAVLDLLPSLGMSATASFSDDHFLLQHDWTTLGATVAGNLLKVVQIPARRASVEAEADLLRQKALAVTATVMTQVIVSRVRQRNAAEQLATAREYRDVQTLLVKLLGAQKESDLIGEQTLIREEMNLLIAEIQHDIALGGLQSASSSLMTALGYDLQGTGLNTEQDIKALSGAIRANWPDRAAVSDRGRYLAELDKARRKAERQRLEAERRRQAEAKRIVDAARQAAATEASQRQAEAKRLKQEADWARREAQLARRGAAKRGTAPEPKTQPVWPWIWPTPDEPRSGGLKDTVDVQRPSRTPAASAKSDGLYSGTK